MKKYKIVCYWPSEKWAVLERVEKDDHTTDWMGAHICTAKGEDGYKEAKQWLKDNREPIDQKHGDTVPSVEAHD